MDDAGPTASYIFFMVLLLIQMFLYAFDSAIHHLNLKEVISRAEDADKRAKRLSEIMLRPNLYVNTVQLVITLIHLIMGGFFLDRFIRIAHMLIQVQFKVVAAIAATALLMYVLLAFGMLIPKRLAAKFPIQCAYFGITAIFYLTRLLWPVTGIVTLTAKGILHIFGIQIEKDSQDVTEEEIISMVNEGHVQGVLLDTEAEMITNIFEFGDKEAKDIMTHRKHILAIDKEMLLQDAVAYMLSENKSRFPVYEDNIDNIVGILHLRDAMRAHADERLWEKSICEISGPVREAVFIPETKNIDGLFQYMQQAKTQMVIVIDEYGQTVGLIAMEDILEEIVGNIMDEYDEDEEYIEETGNQDEYIIEGKTPLEDLEERLSISFHEEEFETLNGFLISKMDKIPDQNEEFDIDVDDYNFKILSVENKMIQSILVTKRRVDKLKGE